jgi:hypothetical protein
MDYKMMMMMCTLFVGTMQTARGMEDDVQQRADELRKKIQNTVQEMEKEAQAKADAFLNLEALIRPNAQIIATESEFTEVKAEVSAFYQQLKKSKNVGIIGTAEADKATSLVKKIEIAIQQYQARINSKN